MRALPVSSHIFRVTPFVYAHVFVHTYTHSQAACVHGGVFVCVGIGGSNEMLVCGFLYTKDSVHGVVIYEAFSKNNQATIQHPPSYRVLNSERIHSLESLGFTVRTHHATLLLVYSLVGVIKMDGNVKRIFEIFFPGCGKIVAIQM